MLQRIQERVQGWFAWLIIVVIGITFTLFGASYYLGQKGASETMTVVGKSVITKGEFEVAYRRLKRQAKVLTATLERQLKEQAMKELIFNHAILDAAESEGFVISKKQAQAAIMAIPQFLEEGQFSEQRFNQILSSNLYTPDSFFKQVTQGMLINQQRFLFSATSFALPDEVNRFITLASQKRDYRYISLLPSLFDRIVVNDREITTYYQAHQKDFMKEARVSIEYVELSMKALAKTIHLSELDLKSYYDDNKGNYVTPARYKLEHILISAANEKEEKGKLNQIDQALKKGTPFGEVATRYSSDLLSPRGELPWMTAGTMGVAFDKALVSLKKGEVSKPIKTKQGLEIITLIDKTDKEVQSFEKVKDSIRQSLIQEEVQKQFVQKSEELADLSYQNPDSLAPTAKSLELSVQSTPTFTRKGLSTGVPHNHNIIQAAFSEEVLIQGDNSQPIQLNDDAIVVLRVKSHEPAKVLSLTEVKDKVTQLVKREKQVEKVNALGQTILSALKNNQSVDTLLKNNKLSWTSLKEANRDETKVAAPINQYAFNIREVNTATPAFEGKFIQEIDSFVIIGLDKIIPGDPTKISPTEKKAIEEQLATNHGMRDYDLYLQGLMTNTKVERKI